MTVRVIAGLGNPGERYDGTRHNAGFAVVDALAQSEGAVWRASTRFSAHTADVVIAGKPVTLVKPQAYMNRSGQVLGELFRFHKWRPEGLLVAVDEFQIPVGAAKLSIGGSAGGHNGLADIIARIGAGFVRYRIGVGPDTKPLMDIADFVLRPFAPDELERFRSALPQFVEGLRLVVRSGPLLAMNHLNRKTNNNERNAD